MTCMQEQLEAKLDWRVAVDWNLYGIKLLHMQRGRILKIMFLI